MKNKLLKLDLSLIIILSLPIFILIILVSKSFPKITFLMVSLAVLLYLVVAIFHHLKDKSLKLEIVIEYILIAALALIIFQGLIG